MDTVLTKPAQVVANEHPQPPIWVYPFDALEILEEQGLAEKWDDVRALLGGKGANLAEMTRLGVPVPPGFTVTTVACNAYLRNDRRFPPGMWEEEVAAMHKLEQ